VSSDVVRGDLRSPRTTSLNEWIIVAFVGFSSTFLLRILIFKGLTARRLYKSFGVKGLRKRYFGTKLSALLFWWYLHCSSVTYSLFISQLYLSLTYPLYLVLKFTCFSSVSTAQTPHIYSIILTFVTVQTSRIIATRKVWYYLTYLFPVASNGKQENACQWYYTDLPHRACDDLD
jgi:hypothetical protein